MPRIKPRSSRRAPPLKDSDYDHEITLVDHAAEARTQEATGPDSDAGPSSVRRHSTNEPLVSQGESSSQPPAEESESPEEDVSHPPIIPQTGPVVEVEQPTPIEHPQIHNGSKNKTPPRKKTPESAIDILYENERGGFLCGVALFSSKALGNLDPPPWTNFAFKASPTNIHTAQVPDPSWEWAWPEWRVNHDEGCDQGGWKYSFMFAKKFSWHGPKWYSSFVRRRAWIRKRAKKGPGLSDCDPHLLNPEYFTVESAEVKRSSSRASTHMGSRASVSQLSSAGTEVEELKQDIEDVETLLEVLRKARIDREKIEAVDNYLENTTDELIRLQDEMHEIMSLFVFQASRKLLLAKLTKVYDRAVEMKATKGKKEEEDPELQRKIDNLKAAIKHADEEVKKLEFWSDVKSLAVSGASKGAVDERQGWDTASWQGVDKSGPAEPGPP